MSAPNGLNTVKLGYGKFSVTSVQQSGSGNLVTVSASNMPAVNDYVLITGNTNAPSSFVKVTATPSGTTFRINYTSGSGTVSGGYLWLGKSLNVLHSDDENIQIVSVQKTRLDKVILENIKGYRTVLNIRTEAVTDTERLFLYQFAKSDAQAAEVFGILYSDVLLMDSEVVTDLIEGYILATPVSMTLVDRQVTSAASGYSPGSTSSAGYLASAPLGCRVKLTMNWGAGDVSRLFTVNIANIYPVRLERKDWTHIDEAMGRVNFGMRPMVNLDFGNFGYGGTTSDIEADLAWIKNFCLAPSKRIEVFQVFVADVVNNFDSVNVGYLDGFIFAKSLQLSFIGRSLVDLQTNATGTFTLDDNTYGTLDNNNLG